MNGTTNAYECPICRYHGPFLGVCVSTGRRPYAKCPQCGSLERQRLQWLTLERITGGVRFQSALHVAPEDVLSPALRLCSATYVRADRGQHKVDVQCDILCLPFRDKTFDLVYASHVLEHVQDDATALAEIKRVAMSTAIAILPVPILGGETVEYSSPRAEECGHVRLPGMDYFDRYRRVFPRVDIHSSYSFPRRFQLFIHEEGGRAAWPCLPGHPGCRRYPDFVPICRLSGPSHPAKGHDR